MDDRSPTVFVVTLVLGVLTTAFVGFRIISKLWVVKRFALDDIFAVVAWVFATAVTATICAGARVGLGRYDVDIPPEWAEPLKRAIYAFSVLYNPALMATKTSILILYIRMAAAHPILRYASWATLAIVNIAGLTLTFLGLFQCKPISAGWTDAVDGECIDVVAMYLASAPINILTDLAILCLPLPILTGLRMEFKQKVALVCTFVVGGFVAIVDVVRILYLQNSLRETREWDSGTAITASTRPPNFTYHASFSLMWSSIEVSVGLMCCCVLVLKPLVMRVMPSILGGRARRESRMATAGSLALSDTSKDVRSTEQHSTYLPALSPGSTDVPHSIDFAWPGQSPRMTKPALEMVPEHDIPRLSDEPLRGRTSDASNPSVGARRDGSTATATATDEDDDDGGLDFFQMLAADPPEIPPAPPSLARYPTAESKSPRTSVVRRTTLLSPLRPSVEKMSEPLQAPTQNFFDFVNMKGKTPLTQLSRREAWWPILFVSTLFFLWGFAYGLLGSLNGQIQNLLGYSAAQTFALHNAYWIGYLLGPPLIGYWTLTREGFKATFIAGLAIYCCGAMSYWPSSVLRSYPGFFVSNFIVALGLSVLEVAANPFVALAGPGELSESRLCFSQGIQGVGSVISPILANRALFTDLSENDLFRVQWCYLAVALFVVALAVVFFYVPLSEATDDELEAMATQRLYNADMDHGEKAYGVDARKLLLGSGVVLMGTYVGSQESVSYFWGTVSRGVWASFNSANSASIGSAVFALGRFLGSALTYFFPPRYVLFGYIFGSFLVSLLAMALPPGPAAMAFLILLLFFESAIFPLVFAMVLRGQGKHTKLAATVMTMSISGGAVWPSVVYGVDMRHTNDPRYSIRVTTGLYAVAMLWPIALSVNKTMRRWLDPVWSRRALAAGPSGGGEGSASGSSGSTMVDWPTPASLHGKTLPTHIEVTEAPAELAEEMDKREKREEDVVAIAEAGAGTLEHLDAPSDVAAGGRKGRDRKRSVTFENG